MAWGSSARSDPSQTLQERLGFWAGHFPGPGSHWKCWWTGSPPTPSQSNGPHPAYRSQPFLPGGGILARGQAGGAQLAALQVLIEGRGWQPAATAPAGGEVHGLGGRWLPGLSAGQGPGAPACPRRRHLCPGRLRCSSRRGSHEERRPGAPVPAAPGAR